MHGYDLQQLVADGANKTWSNDLSKFQKQRVLEEVWIAIDRVVQDVLGQGKQTLKLGNVAKFSIDQDSGKPLFAFLDGFCRTYAIKQPKSQNTTQDVVEDLCLSTLAIRYSKTLSKETAALGFKAIFQALGIAIGNGRDVKVPLGTVGQLVSSNGRPSFMFSHTFLNQYKFLPNAAASDGLDVGTVNEQMDGLCVSGERVAREPSKLFQPVRRQASLTGFEAHENVPDIPDDQPILEDLESNPHGFEFAQSPKSYFNVKSPKHAKSPAQGASLKPLSPTNRQIVAPMSAIRMPSNAEEEQKVDIASSPLARLRRQRHSFSTSGKARSFADSLTVETVTSKSGGPVAAESPTLGRLKRVGKTASESDLALSWSQDADHQQDLRQKLHQAALITGQATPAHAQLPKPEAGRLASMSCSPVACRLSPFKSVAIGADQKDTSIGYDNRTEKTRAATNAIGMFMIQ